MKLDKVLVVGAGRLGMAVTRRLFELGVKVVVVDRDEKKLEDVRQFAHETILMDSSDKEALAELAQYNFDAGIIAVGESFTTVLLISVYLRNMGIPFIVGRAANKTQSEILERLGCNLIILPEEIVGENLAERLIMGDVRKLELSKRHIIAEVPVAPEFWGKRLGELNFIEKGLILCALKKPVPQSRKEEFNFIPPDAHETLVEEGDFFILLGERKRLAKFSEI